MDKEFISSPNNFQHMEGVESMDFKHTFSLDGTGNDETLRLYLRKAGLSDEIDCLTADQRRAFIYDIIKSNKMPGFWMPSTMTKNTHYNLSKSNTTPPNTLTPLHARSVPATPVMKRQTDPAVPNTLKYATISTYSSSHSLDSLGRSSPIVPRRYEPPPPTPPSPSTFVTSVKGSKYEISGPMNFQHMAGDMTRDRTRNAFDLSMTTTDNVLRKYMIERGIKEEDLRGIRRQDLITNIVQSKFTWMPPKRNVKDMDSPAFSDFTYAESSIHKTPSSPPRTLRSRKTMNAPPPPPPIAYKPTLSQNVSTISRSTLPSPTASVQEKTLAASQSSLSFLSGRFAEPSEFPSIEDIYSGKALVEVDSQSSTQSSLTYRKPAPTPPVKLQRIVETTPPPPSLVKAGDNSIASLIYHSNQSLKKLDEIAVCDRGVRRSEVLPEPTITIPTNENIYSTIKPLNIVGRKVKPIDGDNLYSGVARVKKSARPIPPPKPGLKPQPITNVSAIPPPPPPPVPSSAKIYSSNAILSGGIPPPSIISVIPTPPPPPQAMLNKAAHNSSEPPMPPPLPMFKGNDEPFEVETAFKDNGDERGAFLDSIRKGVTLKKVSQAATVDIIKPRVEHNPTTNDFLSELKMGLTLRRVKNKNDNSYVGDDPDESQA